MCKHIIIALRYTLPENNAQFVYGTFIQETVGLYNNSRAGMLISHRCKDIACTCMRAAVKHKHM